MTQQNTMPDIAFIFEDVWNDKQWDDGSGTKYIRADLLQNPEPITEFNEELFNMCRKDDYIGIYKYILWRILK